MRKLLILFIILCFYSVTGVCFAQGSPEQKGPILLDARRELQDRKLKEEAEKPWLLKLYEQFLSLIGQGPQEEKKKVFRHDVTPEFFVQDHCEECRMLERFFEDSKMPYIRYDIQRDLKGAQIYQSLGVDALPLTRIGNIVVKGYDPKRIEALMQP